MGGSITQTSVIEWVVGPFVFLPMAAFDFHFHSGGSTVVEQDSGECSNEAHSFPDVEGTGRPEKNIAHKLVPKRPSFSPLTASFFLKIPVLHTDWFVTPCCYPSFFPYRIYPLYYIYPK